MSDNNVPLTPVSFNFDALKGFNAKAAPQPTPPPTSRSEAASTLDQDTGVALSWSSARSIGLVMSLSAVPPLCFPTTRDPRRPTATPQDGRPDGVTAAALGIVTSEFPPSATSAPALVQESRVGGQVSREGSWQQGSSEPGPSAAGLPEEVYSSGAQPTTFQPCRPPFEITSWASSRPLGHLESGALPTGSHGQLEALALLSGSGQDLSYSGAWLHRTNLDNASPAPDAAQTSWPPKQRKGMPWT
jgi:hypothetical protein